MGQRAWLYLAATGFGMACNLGPAFTAGINLVSGRVNWAMVVL